MTRYVQTLASANSEQPLVFSADTEPQEGAMTVTLTNDSPVPLLSIVVTPEEALQMAGVLRQAAIEALPMSQRSEVTT